MNAQAALKVMSTVNAPYGEDLSPRELARRLADPESATSFDASAFAFLSEVDPALQRAFVREMGVDAHAISTVAREMAARSGHDLELARMDVTDPDIHPFGTDRQTA